MAGTEELNQTDTLPRDSVFAKALQSRRGLLNARFAQAKHICPTLDAGEFRKHMLQVMRPAIDAAENFGAQNVDELVEILFELALELTIKDLAGKRSRCPLIDKAWQSVLVQSIPLLLLHPQDITASISNAVYNIWQEAPAMCHLWIREMARISPQCPDIDRFKSAGIVISWRCGMAHYREGAIAALSTLSPELAASCLGLKTPLKDVPEACRNLRQDPWFHPSCLGASKQKKSLEIVSTVGSFIGFGGLFNRPPLVFKRDESLYVQDAEKFYLLDADIFGAILHRCEKPEAYSIMRVDKENKRDGILAIAKSILDKSNFSAQAPLSFDRGEVFFEGNASKHFSILENATSVVVTDSYIAVSTADSHRVYLVANCTLPENA